jgi:hypothetical protein
MATKPNPKLTPELRRQYRERLKLSREFAAELADHEKAIAGMTTRVATYDPLDDELEDCFNEDGDQVEAPVDYHGLPRTRSSALYHGTSQYSTGKPCIQDHDSPRWTVSGRCVLCQEEGDAERAEIEARLATRRHRKPVVTTK